MSEVAPLGIKDVKLSASINRADGTVEDLGVIASMSDGTIEVDEKGLLNRIRHIFEKEN